MHGVSGANLALKMPVVMCKELAIAFDHQFEMMTLCVLTALFSFPLPRSMEVFDALGIWR